MGDDTQKDVKAVEEQVEEKPTSELTEEASSESSPEDSSSSNEASDAASGEADSEKSTERYVPLSVVQKERRKRQEAERRVKELEAQSGGGQAITPAPSHGLTVEESRFIKRMDYLVGSTPEYAEYEQDVEHLFTLEEKKNGREVALDKGADYYFKKAQRLALDEDAIRKEGSTEAIKKINRKNLVSSESAKSSSVKPSSDSNRLTPEKIKSMPMSEYKKLTPEQIQRAYRGE